MNERSAAGRDASDARGGLRFAGALLAALVVVYAALVHHGVGPDLAGADGRWYEPRGWLRLPLSGLGDGPAIASISAVAFALTAAVVATSRSAVARWLALSGAIASACFAYYGLAFPLPWRVFGGHWSAAIATFALVAGGALASVWLAASWRERGWSLRALFYAPVFLVVVALERNVTGTDPSLPLALSPWPAVPVFGLGVVAFTVAFVLLGVAGGLALHASSAAARRRVLVSAAGAVLGVGVPWLALAFAAQQGLLPFSAGPGLYGLVTAGALLLLAAAAPPLRHRPEPAGERARLFALSAILLGLPLVTGQTLARLDYAVTRNERAQQLIEALQAHFAEEHVYPDSLDELVEAGRLASVPAPRIGFAPFGQSAFVYQNFGTSFLLEFHATRWIQCAYNPPYDDEDDLDGHAPDDRGFGAGRARDSAPHSALDDDGDGLEGAWSCPSNPPELW